MKHKTILILITILLPGILRAQDVITRTDSVRINAVVVEVGRDIVRYKIFGDTEGTVYSMPRSKVSSIEYSSISIPDGEMSRADSRGSKILINGVPYAARDVASFMTDADREMFTQGRTAVGFGEALMWAGAGIGVGWTIVSTFRSRTSKPELLGLGTRDMWGICCGAAAVGLMVRLIGVSRIDTAIASYNSALNDGRKAEVSVGVQQNGVGLSVKF